MDLDEFLSPVPLFGNVKPMSAASLLDATDAGSGGTGDISFKSLEFGVVSSSDVRSITSHLRQGQLPRLKDRQDIASSAVCYNPGSGMPGKAAVRCDRGLGFTAHHAALRDDGFGMQIKQSKQKDTKLRIWHARRASAQMSCYYDPPKDDA